MRWFWDPCLLLVIGLGLAHLVWIFLLASLEMANHRQLDPSKSQAPFLKSSGVGQASVKLGKPNTLLIFKKRQTRLVPYSFSSSKEGGLDGSMPSNQCLSSLPQPLQEQKSIIEALLSEAARFKGTSHLYVSFFRGTISSSSSSLSMANQSDHQVVNKLTPWSQEGILPKFL